MNYGYAFPIQKAYQIERIKSGVQYKINPFGIELSIKITIDKKKEDKARKEEIKKNLLEALNKNR